jgi:exonuclease III
MKKSKRRPKLSQAYINIITNNINGLQMKSSPCRLDLIIQNMYSENIDILLIQEINTHLLHPTVKKELHRMKSRYPN